MTGSPKSVTMSWRILATIDQMYMIANLLYFGQDSGGEDCEYLYPLPGWGRNPEYVSLKGYDDRGQYGFYAPMNKASSDDDGTATRTGTPTTNSIISG